MQKIQSDMVSFEDRRRSQMDDDRVMIYEMAAQIEELQQMLSDALHQQVKDKKVTEAKDLRV